MPRSNRDTLLATLAYLILAAVMTWPLIARLGTHVPMGKADIWLNYWNLWWWKTSLLQGQSPYHSEMIFFPAGVPLGLHTHSPANMLATLPVNVLFGVGPALNLAILAGFFLAGLGGFLLAREYTRKALPAFLGGLAFAYFPQHVDQATEHLNLASYWAMPLFLWALVHSMRDGGRLWATATGCFFALNALLAWHNALLAIPLAIGLAAFEYWQGSRPLRRVTLDLIGAATLSLILMSPFLWPLLRDTLAGAAALQKPLFDKPIAVASLWLPHPGHPIWGPLLTDRHLELRTYISVGSIGYLGIVTLGLALCSIRIGRGGRTGNSTADVSVPRGATLFWWLFFLFFLILSLGEVLEVSLLGTPASLPLPFAWLKAVPVFGLVRIANRFFVPAMLALSVLAAMGAERLGAGVAPGRRSHLMVLLGFAMLLDYAWLPFPMREIPRPDWPERLAGFSGDQAILDIPTSHDPPGAFENFLQTEHGRPIVGGYFASGFRPARHQLRDFPALWTIRVPYAPAKARQVQVELAETARMMGVGFVVVHLDRTREQLHSAARALSPESSNRYHRVRLYDPKTALPQKVLTQVRHELTSAFGDPIIQTPKVEIYRVSSSTGLP